MEKSIALDNAGPWPIKGVDRETRTALKKAAKKQGKTLGDFFNTTLREHAQGIIGSKPQVPMKMEEVVTDIDQLKQQMQQIMQRLDERPTSFWERFAGKRKNKG